MLYNDIHGNTGNGLYLNAGGDSNVNYNNLYDNGAYDLKNGNSYNINGQHNFWGTSTTTDEININIGDNPKNISSIYDYNDDQLLGTVDYANWLNDYIYR